MSGIKLPSMPGASAVAKPTPAPGVQAPAKPISSTAVKTPKSKSMPDATDKPSLFFKNEEFQTAKHPSVQKLRDFLDKKHKKT
jgi:hypothetical protein